MRGKKYIFWFDVNFFQKKKEGLSKHVTAAATTDILIGYGVR